MALMAMMAGTGLTSSASHPYCIFIDGLDVAKEAGSPGSLFGVDVDSLVITEVIGQPSTAEFIVEDPGSELSGLRKNADVYICDHRGARSSTGVWRTDDLFRGFITSMTAIPNGMIDRWAIKAVSLDGLMDRRVVVEGVFPSGMTAAAAFSQLFSDLDPRVSALDRDSGAISVQHGDMPNLINGQGLATKTLAAAVSVRGKTYRAAAKALNDAILILDTSGRWGDLAGSIVDIDVQGRVRWSPSFGILPVPAVLGPFDSQFIYEGATALTADYIGYPAPADIDAAVDTSNLVTAVYVHGVDAASSGWYLNTPSLGTYGRIESFQDAPQCVNEPMAHAFAVAFLADHRAFQRLRFRLSGSHDQLLPSTKDDRWGTGWHARSAARPVSDSGYWTDPGVTLPIHGLIRRFQGGGLHMSVEPSFLGPAASGASALAAALAGVVDNAKAATKIPGVLEEVAVRTKAGIPTDADFDVPRDGFIVVDTTNGAIWFRDGGSWIRAGTPTGSILPWGKTTAPDGFLLCDGAAVSRTTYDKLFAAIGTNYGVGDGSTTFNVPDLNDKILVGGAPGAGGGTQSPAAAPATHQHSQTVKGIGGTFYFNNAGYGTGANNTMAKFITPTGNDTSTLASDLTSAVAGGAALKNVLARFIIAI